MKGHITKIQKFSLHDGPGIRTTVFMQGCPLSCVWCQNPETIAVHPEVMFHASDCIDCGKCLEVCSSKCFSFEAKRRFNSSKCSRCGRCIEKCPAKALCWSSTEMSSDAVLEEILKDKTFYDCSGGGVTLSGGEPLQQAEFCLEIASRAKKAGLHVAIDTSGYVAVEIIDSILPFVDLFLYDIKIFDRERHVKYTGRSNEIVLSNFSKLCKTDKDIIVRIPVIPGITNQETNIDQIKDYVDGEKKGLKIELVPFNIMMETKYNMLGKKHKGGIR